MESVAAERRLGERDKTCTKTKGPAGIKPGMFVLGCSTYFMYKSNINDMTICIIIETSIGAALQIQFQVLSVDD